MRGEDNTYLWVERQYLVRDHAVFVMWFQLLQNTWLHWGAGYFSSTRCEISLVEWGMSSIRELLLATNVCVPLLNLYGDCTQRTRFHQPSLSLTLASWQPGKQFQKKAMNKGQSNFRDLDSRIAREPAYSAHSRLRADLLISRWWQVSPTNPSHLKHTHKIATEANCS